MDGRAPRPPFSDTTSTWLAEAAEGRVVFKGVPSAGFLNPLGTVHGGWTAGILDSAMACAVHSTLKAGEAYTTLEFKVHCTRAVMPDTGEVSCEGLILTRGRTVATSHGFLRDAAGRLLAHGTETCLVMPARRA